MLRPFGVFGTILVIFWMFLAAAMIANPAKIFLLLGRRSPIRRELILAFRVLGLVNVIGCAYLLFVYRG